MTNRTQGVWKLLHASKGRMKSDSCSGKWSTTAAMKGHNPNNTPTNNLHQYQEYLTGATFTRNKATFMAGYSRPKTRPSQPVKRDIPSFTLTNPHSPATKEIIAKRKVKAIIRILHNEVHQ